MNDNINISVILPTYNVEDCIERCIKSLQKQSLEGLEFVFVDDCSDDNTVNIIEKYIKDDSRFILIRNSENIGPGKCRNIGIEKARGRYLSFVDPDDYIHENFYSNLYTKATQSGSDLVKGQRITIDKSGIKQVSKLNKKIKKSLRKNIPLYYLLYSEHNAILYKKTFIKKRSIKYGVSKASEDKTFLLRVCLNNPSISIEDNAVYYYCYRQQSITNNNRYQRCYYEIDSLREIVNEIYANNKTYDNTDIYISKYLQIVIKHIFDVYSKNITIDDELNFISEFKKIIISIPDYKILMKDFVELSVLINSCYFIPLKSNNHDLQNLCLRRWVNYLSKKESSKYLNYFTYVLSFIAISSILSKKTNVNNIKNIKDCIFKLDRKSRLKVYAYIPANIVKLIIKGIKYKLRNVA